MATTENSFTGDGVTVTFSFTFPYIQDNDVKASINGVVTTAYSFANATTLQFDSAPANGAAVRIYRETSDLSLQAVFYAGSSIRAEDLNDNGLQSLYLVQEAKALAVAADASAVATQAQTAVNTANTALTTANNASTTANGIASTANTALSNSSTAVSTANTANSTANTANSTANTANSTANSALSTANSATSTANTALSTAQSLNPTGMVIWVAMSSAPTGFIKCNGAAVSRTTYSALFTAIGTTFGSGDGSTTFNVPDLRGEFVRGWDDSRGVDSGRSFGSFQADELKSHTHPYDASRGGSDYGGANPASGSPSSGTTGATGGTETRPRNVALLACIKT